MDTLCLILLFTSACGALSAGVAGVFLMLPEARRNALLPHLVSFATGALLGAALIALLPHALDAGGNTHGVGLALAGGIIAFFILEKMVLWRHCHIDACEAHDDVVLGLLTGNLVVGAERKLRAVGIDPGRFEVGAFGSDHEDRPALAAIARRRVQSPPGARVVFPDPTRLSIPGGRFQVARCPPHSLIY